MSENTKKPYSYFFTDLSLFNQISTDKAFGPVDNNKFQVTTKFKGTLPAYAVTDGLLFFAKCGNSDPNKINILLKPTKDVGLGFKIKYFVYRGIDKRDFFTKVSGVDVVNPSSPLPFVSSAWDTYVEFYGSSDDFKASKLGLDVSGVPTQDILKMFYPKDSYNLLYIDGGKQLGKFLTDAGGFEIVLDEGDFIQENPDSGLVFDKDFAEAEECILRVNEAPTANFIFGGNVGGTSRAKIFKENVYKFIDPAAFYGVHAKDIYYDDGSLVETGVMTNAGKSITSTEIYSNIISKFTNKDKIYFYIKNNLNRSIQFYDDDNNEIRINAVVESLRTPTTENKSKGWPIIIYENKINIALQIREGLKSNMYSNLTFKSDTPKINTNIISDSVSVYDIVLPRKDTTTKKIYTSLVYITQDSNNYDLDRFFGPVTLDTIFEEADFSIGSHKLSWVNHLRNLLVKKGSELGVYNTKVIIDSTNSATADKKLRTFFVAPVASSIQNNASFTERIDAKYMTSGYVKEAIGTSSDFCKKVLGQDNAEIWRGEIKEGAAAPINSLVFRKDENVDNHPVFILGLTEQDLTTLKASLPADATNIFIKLGPNVAGASDHLQFAKYNAVLSYDDSSGVRTVNSGTVVFYSVDNQLFFTKLYSANFPNEFCSEFADITVDFRPQNRWMQYFNYPLQTVKTVLGVPSVFYGLDWLRKGDSERKGKPGDTIDSTNNRLRYRVAEEFKVDVSTSPLNGQVFNNFFETVSYNSSGEGPYTAIPRKDLYVNVKGMYRVIPVKWKLKEGPLFSSFDTTQTEPGSNYDKDYAPSWLNIPRQGSTNPSIKLRLKVRLKNSRPKTDLKLCFDQKLFKIKTLGSLTGSELLARTSKEKLNSVNVGREQSIDEEIGVVKFKPNDLPTGTTASPSSMNWIDFELENIAPITQLSIISIWSNDRLAGKMYIVPNQNLTEKKVLIIKVKDVSETAKGTYDDNEIEIMKKFALQSNILVDAKVHTEELPFYNNSTFNKFKDPTATRINYNNKQDNQTFAEFLKTQIPADSKNDVVVFYFSLMAIENGVLGHTYVDDGIICMFNYNNKYKSSYTTTYFYALAHEYLHSQGVSHSFSGLEPGTPDALLTFAGGTTNNVMDYNNDESDTATFKFVQNSFFWQWAIANKYSKKNT
ncbi:hypothetical protein [Chryseobacterium oncorhynchi]|uniref:Uncharacterized protein n=1 Tax=Chryseobacterium oncorhynchi TaxID=741074 RepID=A0A316WNZ7_9FLAO|nr:hypothetical protein [Chryseobacterium oncorhynchi]PWN62123.1 hypothetical protein C1638_016580 [Chryseobacterium oncorhynchi]